LYAAPSLSRLHPTFQPIQSSNGLMITGVCSSFVQHRHRLPIQCHKLPFESQIANPCHVFIPFSVIVFKEQRQARSHIPMSAIQWDLNDVRRLGKDEFLDRLKVAGSGEVKVVAVAEELEGLRGAGGVGSPNKDRMELDLTSEAMGF
jgi:hypothetical protein